LTAKKSQELIRQHLDARGFQDIEITLLGGEDPAMDVQDSDVRQAAINACQKTYQQEPLVFPWFAGSGPMFALSVDLGIPVIAAGTTWNPDSRAHSPNENILVKDYFDSFRFTAYLLDEYANL